MQTLIIILMVLIIIGTTYWHSYCMRSIIADIRMEKSFEADHLSYIIYINAAYLFMLYGAFHVLFRIDVHMGGIL